MNIFFKFSTTKTICILLCHLCKLHLNPQLFLDGNPIPVAEEVKFLGIIFDKKTLLPHLRYLINKCTKSINVLCAVAHISLGADQQTILHLYGSLIRSKMGYGCIVYSSARGSYFLIYTCWNRYRTKLFVYALVLIELLHPLACVFSQMNHRSIYGGKNYQSRYSLKLSSCKNNPTYSTVFNAKFKDTFDRKPNETPPLAIQIQPDLQISYNILILQ